MVGESAACGPCSAASGDASVASAIRSAKSGDVAALSAWLDAGHAPDTYDADGWSPLLWAAARGRAAAVDLLLARGADPKHAHMRSGALALHVAAQSGDVPTVTRLLDAAPDTRDAVYDINGHTALLQAVFYGHLDLARMLVARGADTAITTARGLGPLELAAQFQNRRMVEIIRPFDKPAAAKAAYYARYLARIAPPLAPGEKAAQDLADHLVETIDAGLKAAVRDPRAVDAALGEARACLAQGADVDRLGGPLQQPPLVVAVTGNNGFPPNADAARLRLEIARLLLEAGADPTRREKHPMGAHTVIRAAVFNHLEILKLCAAHCDPQAYADAINEIPLVNGLTAMHDTVLRASMAAPDRLDGYLDQVRWFVSHGGRSDLEDFSGTTQHQLAERAEEPARSKLLAVLDAAA